jgi:chromosome segregation ATPase
VVAFVKQRHGAGHLKMQGAKTELASIERELRQLKRRVAGLEARRIELRAELAGRDCNPTLKQGGRKW